MKTGKIVAGIAVGIVVALIVIPKTRRMITDAVSDISDAFKDLAAKASSSLEDGQEEATKVAGKARELAGSFPSSN
jgi:uncharacterized membrane protein YgaE (UPF0421/DUF939 family)